MKYSDILEAELTRLHVSYRETLKAEEDLIPTARDGSKFLLERINEIHKVLLSQELKSALEA